MKAWWMVVGMVAAMMVLNAQAGDGLQKLMANPWAGDADKALQEQGMTAAPDDPMVQMMTAMLAGLNCSFAETSVHMEMSMFGEKEIVDAGFEVVEDSGSAITIKNTDGEKVGAQSVITFLDDDHIKITEDTPGAPALYLRKTTAEEIAAAAEAAAVTQAELQKTMQESMTTETSETVVTEEAGTAEGVVLEEAPVVVEETAVVEEVAVVEEPTEPRFLVIIPEQIDTEWFWYYYTEVSQNIVQAAVEKALVKKGLDVVDLATVSMFSNPGSVEGVLNKNEALNAAKASGATHLVLGKAGAVMQGRSIAYGMEVIRSKATASVKLIRVSDGKVLDILDAAAEEGGQVQKATGQAALETAAKDLGKKVARAAEKAAAEMQ